MWQGSPHEVLKATAIEQRPPASSFIFSRSVNFVARQAREALAMYYAEDPALLERVSVSSDAFGSWPVFDEHGRLTSYEARAPQQLPRREQVQC